MDIPIGRRYNMELIIYDGFMGDTNIILSRKTRQNLSVGTDDVIQKAILKEH